MPAPRLPLLLGVALSSLGGASAQAQVKELAELSLEELMEVEVTSAARKPQPLSQAPAAAFVITREEIRRSGAANVPELLRLVPGVNVARLDANKWAVSVRGFNDRFANMLLVLVDGRTVYSPVFSGVFWDVQNPMLADVERIEVIRGPGAALWGANAVNGVINIITRHAAETRGGRLDLRAGGWERGHGELRYGAALGEAGHYRVYAKGFDWDDSSRGGGGGSDDGWGLRQLGFRLDWERAGEGFTLQGDAYDGDGHQRLTEAGFTAPYSTTFIDPFTVNGGNLLFRWQGGEPDAARSWSLQAYYDRAERVGLVSRQQSDTFDLDFQSRRPLGGRQELTWGLGYRWVEVDSRGSVNPTFVPEVRDDELFSGFLQDDIALSPRRLHLILGARFEENDYTGGEFQPNARLRWTPDRRHTLWGALSRAVRTPSWSEHDTRYTTRVAATAPPLPALAPLTETRVVGQSRFDSEKLTALELGYRFQPADALSLDLAAFYNEYDDLRSLEIGTPTLAAAPLRWVVPVTVSNRMFGRTSGLELAADWRPRDDWRMQLAYGYLDMRLGLEPGSSDVSSESDEGTSPHHQLSLHSAWDLSPRWELDAWLRHVGRLPTYAIPAYTELDLRLGWRPHPDLELSLIGRNLLDPAHPEFQPEIVTVANTEVERAIAVQLGWRF